MSPKIQITDFARVYPAFDSWPARTNTMTTPLKASSAVRSSAPKVVAAAQPPPVDDGEEDFDEFAAAQADAAATLAADATRARPAAAADEEDEEDETGGAANDDEDGEESAAADIDSASENEVDTNTKALEALGFGMTRLYRGGSVVRPLAMPGYDLCTFLRVPSGLPSLRAQQDASPLVDACYSLSGASRWSLAYMGTRVDRSALARAPSTHKDHLVLGASLVIVWPALTPGTSIKEREEAASREYNGIAYHPATRSYVLFRRADASPGKSDEQRTGAAVTGKAPKPYYVWIPRPSMVASHACRDYLADGAAGDALRARVIAANNVCSTASLGAWARARVRARH